MPVQVGLEWLLIGDAEGSRFQVAELRVVLIDRRSRRQIVPLGRYLKAQDVQEEVVLPSPETVKAPV